MEIVDDNVTGMTKIITYVGGDAYTAPIVYIKQEGGLNPIDEYHYLHRDYLGSILAISDSDANIIEEIQFGAWGLVDNFKNNNQNTTFDHNSLLGRGFTGHEHFFEVGLIHMNGRMYDSKLGRFLSPDNFIQDPYNTQSFNRYGYVWNNPLSYNDPSGEIIFSTAVIAGIIIGAVAGAAAYIGSAIQSGDWNWGGFGMAIIGGGIIGGITGGIGGVAAIGGGALWSAGATAFIGSFFSITVPIGDWNISISPAIAFGNASGFGASLSVGYSDGDWNFSAGIGYMNYGNYNGFGNGTEIRKSILAAYDDGKTGFSLGTNWWSGNLGGGNNDKFHQQTGVLGIRSGDFSLRYENDGKPFYSKGLKAGLGDGNDQYRTAALNLSVGEYSVGFNLFTGKRTHEDYGIERTSTGGSLGVSEGKGIYGEYYKNGFVNESGPPYRLGALTFGYKGYRLGVNSEWVRHAIQNVVIHGSPKWLAGQRMFEMQSGSWNGFIQYKTLNNFTSW